MAASAPAQAEPQAPDGCVTAGRVVTCTYEFVGAEQTLTIPAEVQTLSSITATGAAGGTSAPFLGSTGGTGGAAR